MLHSAPLKSNESDALTQGFIDLLLCSPFSYRYICIDGSLLIYINLSQILSGQNQQARCSPLCQH
jgi:hypothetical protein